jgi:hypothetical protein
MFPMMGLFLVFIPLGGFLLALLLCFLRPLRFLAPFAFLMPLLSAYSAMAGFWGVGIGLERIGFNRWVIALACWLGLLAGAALGGVMGFVVAFGLRRLGHRFFFRPATK